MDKQSLKDLKDKTPEDIRLAEELEQNVPHPREETRKEVKENG